MGPQGVLTALESYVFAHIKLLADNRALAQFIHESIDEPPPGLSQRECARSHVDLRIPSHLSGGLIRAFASVIVGVQIKDHEMPVLQRQPGVDVSKHGIERIVLGQRASGHISRQIRFPDPQAPAVVRLAVDGLVARPVQIHLKPGTQTHDPSRSHRRPLRREGVFLPAARLLVKHHQRTQLIAQLPTVVDGGCHQRPISAFDCPDLINHLSSPRLRHRPPQRRGWGMARRQAPHTTSDAGRGSRSLLRRNAS